jgi:HK97 family phage major capsid protein
MSTRLRELQNELYAKQDGMSRIFDQARRGDGTYDFLEADAFQHLDNQKSALEMIDQLEKELDELQSKVATQEAIEEQDRRLKEKREQRAQVTEVMHHVNGNGQGPMPQMVQKSLGEMVAEAMPRERDNSGHLSFFKEFKIELKTLMTTTAGWLPESTRVPRLAELPLRPIQVLDIFPISNTTDPSIVFMRETTATGNITGGTAEGAAYNEGQLVWAPVTVPVKKITTSLPVTDEQLADVAQVQGIIDARLRYFVRAELDRQVLVGTGASDTMVGIVNTANVLSQAKGGDDIMSAIYKAFVQIRVTGRATPTAVLLHPNDFQDVRLAKDTTGGFIWGHPSQVGPMTLWGVPVVETDILTEGMGLAGDFTAHTQLWSRQGVEVLAGYVGTQFIEGKQTIRASLRAVITVYRPQAMCTITGL